MPLIDFEFDGLSGKGSANFEILFIEEQVEKETLFVHCKDKLSLDLEGKELLIFMVQQVKHMFKDSTDVQT